MDKNKIRQEYSETRTLLDEDKVDTWSRAITDWLWKDALFQSARSVMLYVSMQNEVATRELIRRASETKQVLLPKVHRGQINPCVFSGFDRLRRSKFGVLEPAGETAAPEVTIDLIAVPAISFDRRGFRIGYGKGFYDAFLTRCSCPSVGLAFECQLIDRIPEDHWDRKVDRVVTEKGFYG